MFFICSAQKIDAQVQNIREKQDTISATKSLDTRRAILATKIRLKRMGKKFYAFYRVVIMDSRTKRDGRAIEEIGTYNPNTQPFKTST